MPVVWLALLLAARAVACSCILPGPPCQEAWSGAPVLLGTVLEISVPESPVAQQPSATTMRFRSARRIVRVRVKTWFTGTATGEEVAIQTGYGGGDCGYPFQRGHDYLIYTYKNSEGILEAHICSRTRPVDEAQEDLAYLRSLPTAPDGGEIRVKAFDVDQHAWPPAGLVGVRTSIRGRSGERVATTNRSGEAVFSKLSPGEYVVAGSRKDYTAEPLPKPVSVANKGCAEVFLPMRLNRRVTGLVLGRQGVRVAGVEVQAVPRRPSQENELPFEADSATTDENGRYVLNRLRPGDYYLGINLARTPPATNPYTRWFFPGTESPGSAFVIHVPEQAGVLEFDIPLPPRQAERIVRGIVVRPDGQPAAGVYLTLEDPRWSWQAHSVVNAQTGPDGRFELKCLDGTYYRLHPGGGSLGEPVDIKPGSQPLELRLVVTGQRKGPPVDIYRSLEHWRKGLGLP